ncbi:DUF2202 domain-containing protein [Planobispora siamensis]|nr:DUF2202 domain-containing protein [Planobispora siamensis]
MRKTALAVAGAGLGAALFAVPALAFDGVSTAVSAVQPTPDPWPGGYGPGMGMMGGDGGAPGMGLWGPSAGPAAGSPDARDRSPGACHLSGARAPSGTLSNAQKTALAATAEEEKLSRDLYTAFADRHDLPVLDRIAVREERRLATVRALLARYGLADPTAGRAAGTFATPSVKTTYDRLLAQGATGPQEALNAARTVEKTGIAALQKALDGLTAPDVRQVYTHLLHSSQMHLIALGS